MHLVGCLYYLYQWCTVKQISDNEIYLSIKYIKSVLWKVAKRLSYIQDARCIKVKYLKALDPTLTTRFNVKELWILLYCLFAGFVGLPEQTVVVFLNIINYFGLLRRMLSVRQISISEYWLFKIWAWKSQISSQFILNYMDYNT